MRLRFRSSPTPPLLPGIAEVGVLKVGLVGEFATRLLRAVFLVPLLVSNVVDVAEDLRGEDVVRLANHDTQETGLVVVLGVHDEGTHGRGCAKGDEDAAVDGGFLGVARDVSGRQCKHLDRSAGVAVVEIIAEQHDTDHGAGNGVENGSAGDRHRGQDTDDGCPPLVGLQHQDHGEDTAEDAEETRGHLQGD